MEQPQEHYLITNTPPSNSLNIPVNLSKDLPLCWTFRLGLRDGFRKVGVCGGDVDFNIDEHAIDSDGRATGDLANDDANPAIEDNSYTGAKVR